SPEGPVVILNTTAKGYLGLCSATYKTQMYHSLYLRCVAGTSDSYANLFGVLSANPSASPYNSINIAASGGGTATAAWLNVCNGSGASHFTSFGALTAGNTYGLAATVDGYNNGAGNGAANVYTNGVLVTNNTNINLGPYVASATAP